MAKLAIAVKSCHRDFDAGCHTAIRSTWGKDAKALGVDVFFFMGYDKNQQDTRQLRKFVSGEILVDCKDDYMALPMKTKRICQWASAKMFDHLFLCDNDTYVNASKLVSVDFRRYDYSGFFWDRQPNQAPFHFQDSYGDYPECWAWASGGQGYFISRKAAGTIAEQFPNVWAEDLWVGQVLGPHIAKNQLTAGSVDIYNTATEHFPKTASQPNYDPKFMYLAYEHGGFRNLFRKGLLVL